MRLRQPSVGTHQVGLRVTGREPQSGAAVFSLLAPGRLWSVEFDVNYDIIIPVSQVEENFENFKKKI